MSFHVARCCFSPGIRLNASCFRLSLHLKSLIPVTEGIVALLLALLQIANLGVQFINPGTQGLGLGVHLPALRLSSLYLRFLSLVPGAIGGNVRLLASDGGPFCIQRALLAQDEDEVVRKHAQQHERENRREQGRGTGIDRLHVTHARGLVQ